MCHNARGRYNVSTSYLNDILKYFVTATYPMMWSIRPNVNKVDNNQYEALHKNFTEVSLVAIKNKLIKIQEYAVSFS